MTNHDFRHVDINEMEELHGPLYKFSEHKVGQRITYRNGNETHTGEILWVCAPGEVVEKHIPMCYVVSRDFPNGVVGFPDIVYRNDVLTGGQS